MDVSLLSNKKFICIARELYEDGNPHLHVLIQHKGRAQLTNPRLFDLRSHVLSIYNIPSEHTECQIKLGCEGLHWKRRWLHWLGCVLDWCKIFPGRKTWFIKYLCRCLKLRDGGQCFRNYPRERSTCPFFYNIIILSPMPNAYFLGL